MTERDPAAEHLAALREPEGLGPAEPAAVRARGDRIRRRRYAAVAGAAALAVAAVAIPLGVLATGGERSAPPPVDRPSDSAPADPTPSDPTPSADTPQVQGPVVTTIPEEFPLLAGWPRAGGDGSLTGPSDSAPPVVPRACGRTPDPLLDVQDGLAARLRLPAESRGRAVLLYATARAAQGTSAGMRAVFESCPRDSDTGIPVDYVTTVTDEQLGEEAWVARSSFDNPAQPGRAVFVAVRIGNALLLESVSDEGGDADALAGEVLDALGAPIDSLAHLAPPAPSGELACADGRPATIAIDGGVTSVEPGLDPVAGAVLDQLRAGYLGRALGGEVDGWAPAMDRAAPIRAAGTIVVPVVDQTGVVRALATVEPDGEDRARVVAVTTCPGADAGR